MTLTNCQLFSIIEESKKSRFYSIANTAFVLLADRALDSESFTFVWEFDSQAESKSEIYYDLLVVTDGIRSACIPAPLLRNPLAFRSICSLEIEKREHRRQFSESFSLKAQTLAGKLEKHENLKGLLQKYLKTPINGFNGKGDCLVCSQFESEQSFCKLFKSYPDDGGFCQQWQLG